MSRYYSYLQSAEIIIQSYKGEEPLASFLKKYFAANKKFGSKDRKQVAHLCYCYFRLGKAMPDIPVQERILAAVFLCSQAPDELLSQLKPEWNEKVSLGVVDKYSIINHYYSRQEDLKAIPHVFPWYDELSEGIDADAFSQSHFIQPDLFLRLRPGHIQAVTKKLTTASISFTLIGNTCIALPNSTKADSIVELDKEAVVQDYSSQRVGEVLQLLRLVGTDKLPLVRAEKDKLPLVRAEKDKLPLVRAEKDKLPLVRAEKDKLPLVRAEKDKLPLVRPGRSDQWKVWDCCAASGGKSILAKDILGDVELYVSDVRESMLMNLKKRFATAGITRYHSFIADLAAGDNKGSSQGVLSTIPNMEYSIIICDAPCTGSGTWSRTPEQLFYFEKEKIATYASLQKKIVANAVQYLAPGGYFLYITCSVFKKENEEAVEVLKEKGLLLVKQELITGYHDKADTMFAALLQKPV